MDALKSLIKKGIFLSIEKGKLHKVDSIPEVIIERPSKSCYGDFSTNVAMFCAKMFKMPPREVARTILNDIDYGSLPIEKCEIAGAGFINFFVRGDFYTGVIVDILKEKENYGRCNIGGGKRILVEYVSANPTGPMHMGNARGGALGDCLASLLELAGYDVSREFYINDAGNQIVKFGLSLDIRYKQILNESENDPPLSDECYQGLDIRELSQEFFIVYKDKFVREDDTVRQKALIDFALPRNLQKMKKDLDRYNIHFDKWFSEKSLYDSGQVKATIDEFKDKGLTFEKEGALWFRATDFGAKKDEVLVRSNGMPTYYLVDIVYHKNKFLDRKYDICIDLWGADHAGHVDRMKIALDALGIDSSRLKIIIFQLVRLVKNGKVVKMSKRTGKAINLSGLLDEVPTDAVRFMFNMKSANSQMDFDLSLAVEKNMDNPVYYVQYAYARICSVIKLIMKLEKNLDVVKIVPVTGVFKANEEKELVKTLFCYQSEIISAVKEYDPSKIMKYLLLVAADFHRFYNACKINCDDRDLMYARLALCYCTKIVIKNILDAFKITAPESM